MIKWTLIFTLATQFCHAQESVNKTVFEAQINKGDTLSPEWKLQAAKDCKPVIAASPKGGRIFLSKIPVGQQALAIAKLPEHTHIRVQFDLILKGTWDGHHRSSGPDSWKFDVDGREPLVNGSFCNNVLDKVQSFPDFLSDNYKPNTQFTNALESSTLGYIGVNRGNNVSSDSIYRFDFIIPHTKSSLKLNFESNFIDVGDEPNSEQWYGLDNVKISTISKPKQEPTKWIGAQIDALTSNEASLRHKARRNLLAHDQQFIAVLENRLKEVKNTEIHKLIPLLNDESYQVRSEATLKIQALCKENLSLIEQALKDATEPEIISRLRFITKEGSKDRGSNKQTEISRILKIIDSPKSRNLLRTRSLNIK